MKPTQVKRLDGKPELVEFVHESTKIGFVYRGKKMKIAYRINLYGGSSTDIPPTVYNKMLHVCYGIFMPRNASKSTKTSQLELSL